MHTVLRGVYVMINSVPIRLNASPPSKPCHNCRRKRLRCDRSIPECQKCVSKGENCLGYGNLLRWTNSVAVRGNLAHQISQHQRQCRSKDVILSCDVLPTRRQRVPVGAEIHPLQLPLIDPLLVNLGPRHREYIGHCESHQSGTYSNSGLATQMSDFHQQSSDQSVKT